MRTFGITVMTFICFGRMLYASVELNTARIAYYNERDYPRAINACVKGIEKGERHWELYGILAGSKIGLGKWVEAAEALIEALRIDSTKTFEWMQDKGGGSGYFYQGFYYAAREQHNKKEYDDAFRYLDYAQYIDPTKIDIYILRGTILYEVDAWEKANREYLKALSLDPDNPDINYLIGKALFEAKEFEGARDYFSNAADKYSLSYERTVKVLFQYVQPVTDEHKHKVNRLWDEQRFDDLDRYIKDSLKYEQGFVVLKKTVEQFNKGTNDLARAYYFAGMSYYYVKEYEPAAEYLGKTLRLRPDDIDALYFMGEILVNQQKFSDAIVYFERTTKLKADDLYAWFYLGVCYTQTKQFQKAIDVYENKVLAINPQYVDAMYNLAYVYGEIGNTQKSLYWLKKAEELKGTE